MTKRRFTRTATRVVAGLATLALAAAPTVVIGSTTGPVKASHDCTPDTPGVLFKTCREYPASLPLTFVADTSGSKVANADFLSAVQASIDTWNQAWPFANVFTYGGTSNSGFGRDGKNTISWGNPASCGVPGAAAVACLWFQGATGNAGHIIVEVDIVLNKNETWRQAEGAEVFAGAVTGTVGTATAGWLDVQSVVTHELGHALGLDDIGNETTSWPFALSDAGRHMQTMYRWTYRGSTHMRTLDAGDLAGVLVLWQKL